jgi:uncharacterized protein (TIGR02147 family)
MRRIVISRSFWSKDQANIDRKGNMARDLDIFGFSDYRAYIRAWLADARKKQSSNLSRLSKKIGVHTTFLAHVLSGSKNLSFEQAVEVSEAFGHTKIEEEYFFALIQLERAGSVKLRKYWSDKKEAIEADRKKLNSRVGVHHELTQEQRAIFYSSWIYVAVFVATAIDNGQTQEQIAELFKITRTKANEVLTFLVQSGVCEKSGGKYSMGKTVVYVPNDSPFVVKHHANWRFRAIQKMDQREDSEMFFSSPMSISKSDFQRIREVFAKSIQAALEICKASPAEEVVCLNIDFFKTLT